jgi:hypothetical protein
MPTLKLPANVWNLIQHGNQYHKIVTLRAYCRPECTRKYAYRNQHHKSLLMETNSITMSLLFQIYQQKYLALTINEI